MRKVQVSITESATGFLTVFNYGELSSDSQNRAVGDFRHQKGSNTTKSEIKAEFEAYCYEFTASGYYIPPTDTKIVDGSHRFDTVEDAVKYVKGAILNFTKEKLLSVIQSIEKYGIYINESIMIRVDPDDILKDETPVNFRLN